jgi:hypothetical protein
VKFKHLKNSSLNLSEKFKSGLYEEVISLLEAKPERSREEVQLLAKSYSALGRTTQSLFALINLRGKVSGELDKEIQSGLDALWCRLQSEPHFLESLSVEDLQKAISGFRKKEGSSDLFNQLIQRLTILSLKKKESHHMESTLSLLSAMEFDLGARGFLHLAKLRSQNWFRQKKGDQTSFCHQLVSSGVPYFLYHQNPNKLGFLSFVDLTTSLFFPASTLQEKNLRLSLQKEAMFITQFVADAIQKKIILPNVFLSPSLFHSFPDTSKRKLEFKVFLDSVPAGGALSPNLFLQTEYLYHCFAFHQKEQQQEEFLEVWLKKRYDPNPGPLEMFPLKPLARLLLRHFKEKKVTSHSVLLDLCKDLAKYYPFDYSDFVTEALKNLERDWEELEFWANLLTLEPKTPEMLRAIGRPLMDYLESPEFWTKDQKFWMQWIAKYKPLMAEIDPDISQWLHRFSRAHRIWNSLRSMEFIKAHKKILEGKASDEETKEFFEGFLDSILMNQQWLLASSDWRLNKVIDDIFDSIASINKRKNLFKRWPWLATLKRVPKCQCANCLLKFMDLCRSEWAKEGLITLSSFPKAPSKATPSFEPSIQPPKAEELLFWDGNPYFQLELQPGGPKTQILKKSMEMMRRKTVDLKIIRVAQAALLDAKTGPFLEFFWSDNHDSNAASPLFTHSSKVLDASSMV